MSHEDLLINRKVLAEYSYKWWPIEKGYNNRTLYINVGSGEISEKRCQPRWKRKEFIGGKGFGLRLLWDATKPDTKWNDPENEIIISPGPIGGIYPVFRSRKIVVGFHFATNRLHYGFERWWLFWPVHQICRFRCWSCRERLKRMSSFSLMEPIWIEIYEDPAFQRILIYWVKNWRKLMPETPKDAKNIGIVSTDAAAEGALTDRDD